MHPLDRYLAEHIPLSQAIGIRVHHFGVDGLTLQAPLAGNTNDKGTGFAGALATLVRWRVRKNAGI